MKNFYNNNFDFSAFIEIKPSNIHGMGCYTTIDLPPEIVVLEYFGEIITEEEAIKRSNSENYSFGDYIFSLENGQYIDASKSTCKAKFVNHSCNPNLYVYRNNNRIFFITKRFINKGEELTIDYAFPKEYSIRCLCGSNKCKGYI